jgi:hypothetical protein
MDPDPSVIMQNSKKNLDFYYFVPLFDFLSLENYVNVPSNSNKQKKCLNQIFFCLHLEGQLVRGMDQRIRIRIHSKMSWIRNTAFYMLMMIFFFFLNV